MNHVDSTGSRHHSLSSHAMTVLRGALRELALAALPEDRLRRALREVTELAHAQRVSAEHVLIALKETWTSLPEVQLIPNPAEREECRARLVTLCIEEFYRE
jgi:hypothetical protein